MQLHASALRSAGRSVQGLAYLYESLPEWRSSIVIDGSIDDTARSLSRHKKRYVSLRPIEDGFACRYHDTDVVIWRNVDGVEEVTITPSSSLSTETFAEEYGPHGVRFKFHYDHGDFALVTTPQGVRVYEVGENITFRREPSMDNTWLPYNHTTTATFIDINPPMLRVARNKANYPAFAAWLDAVMSLNPIPVNKAHDDEASKVYRFGRMVALLGDPNKWPAIAGCSYFLNESNRHSPIARAATIKSAICEMIYRHYDVIKRKKVPWYDHAQFERQRQLHAKW